MELLSFSPKYISEIGSKNLNNCWFVKPLNSNPSPYFQETQPSGVPDPVQFSSRHQLVTIHEKH